MNLEIIKMMAELRMRVQCNNTKYKKSKSYNVILKRHLFQVHNEKSICEVCKHDVNIEVNPLVNFKENKILFSFEILVFLVTLYGLILQDLRIVFGGLSFIIVSLYLLVKNENSYLQASEIKKHTLMPEEN